MSEKEIPWLGRCAEILFVDMGKEILHPFCRIFVPNKGSLLSCLYLAQIPTRGVCDVLQVIYKQFLP